jgi:hypothetical protein
MNITKTPITKITAISVILKTLARQARSSINKSNLLLTAVLLKRYIASEITAMMTGFIQNKIFSVAGSMPYLT